MNKTENVFKNNKNNPSEHLKKQFPNFSGGRHEREVVNENFWIFQDPEKIIRVEVIRRDGRRHCTSFCKLEKWL